MVEEPKLNMHKAIHGNVSTLCSNSKIFHLISVLLVVVPKAHCLKIIPLNACNLYWWAGDIKKWIAGCFYGNTRQQVTFKLKTKAPNILSSSDFVKVSHKFS